MAKEYKPFKMKGHTLPGPHQRSSLKYTKAGMDTNIEDPATQGGGWSEKLALMPDAFNLPALMQHKKKTRGYKRVGGSSAPESQPQDVYTDTGIDDSTDTGIDDSAELPPPPGEETTKKKVDVEVTVNDKKI
jgi:hypothetical protein